jgi:hypothetical protein
MLAELHGQRLLLSSPHHRKTLTRDDAAETWLGD